ncbi:tetraspanin-3-like [Liolophura sinensis]|uniref:tetraspanin-3-like n=1 Tax=Liolophura sinensis TaxID=3198878 RepID=UPI0031586141
MSGCSKTSKCILCFLGLIFWAAAAALMFVGVEVFNTYRKYDEITSANLTLIPASVILGVAVFLFIIGLLGCIAAAKESKGCLAVFFSLLLIVLIGEIAAGSLGYAYRGKVREAVENGLENAVNGKGNDTVQQDQIDYIQKTLHCCGVHNATDWVGTPYWVSHDFTLPNSCCKNDNCTGLATPADPSVYPQGCYDLLEKQFLKNLGYIAGAAITIAVLQIFGLICTCILICRSRARGDVPYLTLGSDRSGLQV